MQCFFDTCGNWFIHYGFFYVKVIWCTEVKRLCHLDDVITTEFLCGVWISLMCDSCANPGNETQLFSLSLHKYSDSLIYKSFFISYT